jgi:ankyrin repeat protein
MRYHLRSIAVIPLVALSLLVLIGVMNYILVRNAYEAIGNNNVDLLKKCVKFGLRPNSEYNGDLLLNRAIIIGNDDIVVYLLSKGASINKSSIRTTTRPIHLLAMYGSPRW